MTDAEFAEPFNPMNFITQVNGNDYLEVKWRLAWLRDRHPDAQLITEMVADHRYNETYDTGQTVIVKEAIFKATITIPGGGSAVGHGSETAGDFRDYREKAETKAIGRALASLGFGTQFSGGEYGGEAQAGRVVDAPVRRVVGTSGIAPKIAQGGQGATNTPVQGGTARYPQQAPQGRPVAPQSNQGQVNQQRQNGQGGGGVMGDPNKPASQNQIKYVTDLLRGLNVDPDHFDWTNLTNAEASGYITELRSGKLPADVADALASLAQG